MKKTILSATLLAIASTMAFAQPAKRTSAYNYLQYGELDNAKEAIDAASAHEKTAPEAKTWFYRGQIYQAIYEDRIKGGKFKDLHDDALQISYESFLKCISLDDKKQHLEDVKRYLDVASVNFFNLGIESLQLKEYERASVRFNNVVELGKTGYCPSLNDTLQMLGRFYLGWSNDALGKLDEAAGDYLKAAAMANALKQAEHQTAFLRLINMYRREENTEKQVEAIKLARASLEDPSAFAVEEANVFLGAGDSDQAVEPLRKAVDADPTNYSAWFALGSILEQLAKKVDEAGEVPESSNLFSESRAAYNRSVVEIDKALAAANEEDKAAILAIKFDVVYSIGASYFNMGAKLNDAVSNIVDQKKYDAAMVKVLEIFRKALPVLEEAYAMKPDDHGVLIALNQLYYKLDADDPAYEGKLLEISAKLSKKK